MPLRRDRLRHEDTGFLVGSGLVLLLGTLLLFYTAGRFWAVFWLGFGSAVLMLVEIRRHHRRMQAAHEQLLEAVQALGSLQMRLPLRRSLPPLSGWGASPQLAATLADLVAERRPLVVVELGSGVSTLVLGYALEAAGAGRVLSLDHDAAFAARTRTEVTRHGLADRIEVLDAPLVTHPSQGWRWYDLTALDARLGGAPIDLVVVDGPPRQTAPNARYPAFSLLARHLAPEAVLVADDAARPEMQAAIAAWAREGDFDVETVPSPKGIVVLRRRGR
ncbi:MAG TPA: class I SAM-dependent methyltransferase [Rhodothermales bacterium]|nr:class I SAM-dependent methyltransferase [Rhodothermales bacterium]